MTARIVRPGTTQAVTYGVPANGDTRTVLWGSFDWQLPSGQLWSRVAEGRKQVWS
jgi:hypothetical protein